MVRRIALAGLSIMALIAAPLAAQVPGQASGAPSAEAQAAARAAANALPDTPGTGPYPAIKEIDPTLPNHVVYRPADLSKLGKTPLGVVVWGNGGCLDDGASARFQLAEIASHGYLVIAPGKILSGPGAVPAPGRSPPRAIDPSGKMPPVKTTTQDVLAGLDWALAENARAGSRYKGRIDPKLTGVGGHSCGGLQSIQAGADKRINAVVVQNSGIFADGSNPITGMTVDKSLLKALHTPVLYILGGKTDVAFPNGMDDFEKIDTMPVIVASLDVGHGGTFREPNGGRAAQVVVDWLQWQLRGDKIAARRFAGAECGLCTDPAWTVKRKGID